jgi:fatty acid desaturase
VEVFLKTGILNVKWPFVTIRNHLHTALGRIDPDDPWTNVLFPESEPKKRQAYFSWARIVLVGHALIAGVSLALGWWIVIFVVTFPMMFGMWLFLLCNSSQHTGLCDRVPDFRLCCRTIYLNPILQFLYWHMNYHTEHHMYAAVPCYHLGKLHRLIKDDLPHCPNGLVETWKQIFEIQKRQKIDPDYRYEAELPTPSPATIG